MPLTRSCCRCLRSWSCFPHFDCRQYDGDEATGLITDGHHTLPAKTRLVAFLVRHGHEGGRIDRHRRAPARRVKACAPRRSAVIRFPANWAYKIWFRQHGRVSTQRLLSLRSVCAYRRSLDPQLINEERVNVRFLLDSRRQCGADTVTSLCLGTQQDRVLG